MTGSKSPAERLQVGNYVSLPLGWREHRFCSPASSSKSEEEIELIRRLGLKLVTIIPDKSDTPPKPLGQTQPQADEVEGRVSSPARRRCSRRNCGASSSCRAIAATCSSARETVPPIPGPGAQPHGQDPVPPLNAISEAQELINAMTEQLLLGGRDGAAPGLKQR